MFRVIRGFILALLVLVEFPNAWGQSSNLVKMRTLQIDAWARPGLINRVDGDIVVRRQ